MTVRPAMTNDLPRLQEIERAAGKIFANVGMQFVADDEPPSVEALGEFQRDGRAWVFVNEDDVPVAYLIAAIVDGCAHLEQVSVHPDYARRRIGRHLLDYMIEWARERGFSAITLTTYVDVAWNGPYYEWCGFRYLADEDLTPGLRTIRQHEAEYGLDRWPRASMRREI